RAHLRRPGVEDQWLATYELRDPAHQRHGIDPVASADDPDRPPPDLGEGTIVELEPESLAEQRVVADLTVGVERKVVRGDREPALEGDPQAVGHLVGERTRLGVPEQ